MPYLRGAEIARRKAESQKAKHDENAAVLKKAVVQEMYRMNALLKEISLILNGLSV